MPKLSLRAFVQTDASVGLLYDITLQNGRTAPLSVVRVYTRRQVDRQRIVASLDGDRIADIRFPLRGEPCFEVWLGKRAIPPGKHGRLRLEFTVEREVLADADRDGYARLEIAPTEFDEAADAPTDLTLVAHLLPGVASDEVVAVPDSPAELGTFDGRTTITWRFPSARLGELEPATVAFPARGMTQLARRTWLESAARWLRRSVALRIAAGVGSILLFAFAFLRWTGGRQRAAALVLAATLAALFALSPASQLVAIPVLIVLTAGVEFRRWRRRRAGSRRTGTTANSGAI